MVLGDPLDYEALRQASDRPGSEHHDIGNARFIANDSNRHVTGLQGNKNAEGTPHPQTTAQ